MCHKGNGISVSDDSLSLAKAICRKRSWNPGWLLTGGKSNRSVILGLPLARVTVRWPRRGLGAGQGLDAMLALSEHGVVNVVSSKTIRGYAALHADAAEELVRWNKAASHAVWRDIHHVRQHFPDADQYKSLLIFNIQHHRCPARSRIDSIGCRSRLDRLGSRTLGRPVKWALFQKA
jgi:hypothetical protein